MPLSRPPPVRAQIFIDGGNPAEVNLYSPTTIIAPVFTSSLLSSSTVGGGNGIHTHPGRGGQRQRSRSTTSSWDRPPQRSCGATPDDLVSRHGLDGHAARRIRFQLPELPRYVYLLSAAEHDVARRSRPAVDGQLCSHRFSRLPAIPPAAEVFINVDKATPLITWTGPDTDMFYGQAAPVPPPLNATATRSTG